MDMLNRIVTKMSTKNRTTGNINNDMFNIVIEYGMKIRKFSHKLCRLSLEN